jgi:hypothetical protein
MHMIIFLRCDERLLDSAGANLFRGIEAVGGWLYITSQRIFFQPHPLNIQRQLLELNISDITDAYEINTWKIIPNGMAVVTKSGTEYRFVVWGRARLIATIKSAVANYSRTGVSSSS